MKKLGFAMILWTLILTLCVTLFAACNSQGEQGIQGVQGEKGDAGADGKDGQNGKSAYELACENGFVGTLEEWLASLGGAKGDAGEDAVAPKVRINADTNMWEVSCDDGASWTSLGVPATGNEGVGVSDVHVDENYHLWVELSDGSEIDAGYVGSLYTVVFADYDGSVISTVSGVTHGGSVQPPNDPERAGYNFVGWDKALDSITADMTVTAQYEPVAVQAHNQLSFVFEDNGDGTTTVTLSMRGDVLLYGLECKLAIRAVGMELATVNASASGLLANEMGGVIAVSFVATSGTNVTEDFEMLRMTFANTADVRTVEIAVNDMDIFDDQYQDESYCVAGNTYEN